MPKIEELLGVGRNEIEHGLALHQQSIVCDSLYTMYPDHFSEQMIQKTHEWLDTGKSFQQIQYELRTLYRKELAADPKVRDEYIGSWWKKSGVTCISQTLHGHDFTSAATDIARVDFVINILK